MWREGAENLMIAQPKSVVVGSGGWGTALACSQALHGKPTGLWVRRPELARELQVKRENKTYLPGITIPDSVEISADFQLIEEESLVILAVPVKGMRQVAR